MVREDTPKAQDFALPEDLLALEEIQFELVHDYQRLARNLAKDMVTRLESSVQYHPDFRAEVIRQLELAIQFLSGDQRDSKRASRRVHRVMKAIWILVRSNYTASFKQCFPPHAVRITIKDGDRIISDDEIPPDP